MDSTNIRTIHTGLYGAQAYGVIDSVRGQLSDGKWENTPGYDKYWTNFDVKTADDGEVIINVNAELSTTWCRRFMPNPFRGMSDADVKKWIANKIKAVVNDERKDRHEFGEWDRKNIDHTSLYLGHCDEKYGPVVTVADIYCTYEALLGRNIGATKYDASTISRVFGQKADDATIAKRAEFADAKAKVLADYKKHIAMIDEKVKKFMAEIDADKQQAHKVYCAALENLKTKYEIV